MDYVKDPETIPEVVSLILLIIQVLIEYGFEMDKSAANNKNILKQFSLEEIENHEIDDKKVKKLLGMGWYAQVDIFRYKHYIELDLNSEVIA